MGTEEQKTKRFLYLAIKNLPPTVNMMYRGLHGHRYKTQKTLDYQSDVEAKLSDAWGVQEPITGRAKSKSFSQPNQSANGTLTTG